MGKNNENQCLADKIIFTRKSDGKSTKFEASLSILVESSIPNAAAKNLTDDELRQLVADQMEKVFKVMLKRNLGKIDPDKIPTLEETNVQRY